MGKRRKIVLQVGSGFTIGNSSYRPVRFEKNEPDVVLIQPGGRFFQNIRFFREATRNCGRTSVGGR